MENKLIIPNLIWNINFSNNLIRYGLNKGFTKEEIAYAANISPQYMSTIIRGAANITLNVAEGIAIKINMNAGEMLFN